MTLLDALLHWLRNVPLLSRRAHRLPRVREQAYGPERVQRVLGR